MDQRKLQALWGLKWNPFSRDLPSEALQKRPEIDHFCWRVENLVMDGGFAMISGDPGNGKSAALRITAERLAAIPEVVVGEFSRPQSGIGDFYREMGSLFNMDIRASNRFGGHKALRAKWKAQIEATSFRPVLTFDEAQEMNPCVLTEIRLLSSEKFDTKNLLTVILCGDSRLPEKLKSPELAPVDSRIRTRLKIEPVSRDELSEMLGRSLELAGNPRIMSEELIETLAEHACGNRRAMMTAADELLTEAVRRELKQMDVKLYIEFYSAHQTPQPGLTTARKDSRTVSITKRKAL
jgi:type II secretory pathway predicted ATPase ExeA